MKSFLFCIIFVSSIVQAADQVDPVTTHIRSRKTGEAIKILSRNRKAVDQKNKLGMTPTMVAVSEKNYEALSEILKLKPNLKIRGFENKTALEIAMDEPVPEIVEALLAAGANVNEQNPETGSTVLHAATRSQNLPVIRILLKYKADINIKNKKGDSPIGLAAKRQMRRTYDLLISSLSPAK